MRCAYFFTFSGQHFEVEPRAPQPRVTYRCFDPAGTYFDVVDWRDAEERFWDMVKRTSMTGLFSMARVTRLPDRVYGTERVEQVHRLVMMPVA